MHGAVSRRLVDVEVDDHATEGQVADVCPAPCFEGSNRYPSIRRVALLPRDPADLLELLKHERDPLGGTDQSGYPRLGDHVEVEVRPGRVPGVAYLADHRPALDTLPLPNGYAVGGEVAIERESAVAQVQQTKLPATVWVVIRSVTSGGVLFATPSRTARTVPSATATTSCPYEYQFSFRVESPENSLPFGPTLTQSVANRCGK